MPRMSKFELLAVMQDCIVYLVMCIIDHGACNEKNGMDLLLVLNVSPSFHF
jgi:hypothetical protein